MGQVADQYAQGPEMLAADRDIIAEPITAKSKRCPAAALSLWLERNIPVVKLSIKDATAVIILKTHQEITSFFLRIRSPYLPGETHTNENDSEKPGPV